MVGAVGIVIASVLSKSNKGNGVALPPLFQWVPFGADALEITRNACQLRCSTQYLHPRPYFCGHYSRDDRQIQNSKPLHSMPPRQVHGLGRRSLAPLARAFPLARRVIPARTANEAMLAPAKSGNRQGSLRDLGGEQDNSTDSSAIYIQQDTSKNPAVLEFLNATPFYGFAVPRNVFIRHPLRFKPR